MEQAPRQIGGMSVILFTPIDERHRHAGDGRQIVAGILQGPDAGFAISVVPKTDHEPKD
jgi:hypothetical protein